MNVEVGTALRKAPLGTLVDMLRQQNDVKFDAVVPASDLSYHDGLLHVAGAAVRFVDVADGDLQAFSAPAILAPTQLCEDSLAERLGIPRPYMRRMRESAVRLDVSEVAGWELGNDGDEDERPTMLLLDANVNAWLASLGTKRFLVRAFRTDDPDEIGIARVVLSNRFGFMDHYDVILAALDGVKRAGVDFSGLNVECDLSERNLRVRIDAPTITASAYELLKNYRCPFTGRKGQDYPLVNAGLVIGNSETGGGATTVTDRIVVQVCKNGQTRDIGVREVHVGARLEDGIVRWSEETHKAALAVITSKTADVVATFLNKDHVEAKVREIAEHYGVEIPDPNATLQRVQKAHGFTDAEAASILDCFLRSGDPTAGGVMQAVTATAQNIEDPDRAAELEAAAFGVLTTAADRK